MLQAGGQSGAVGLPHSGNGGSTAWLLPPREGGLVMVGLVLGLGRLRGRHLPNPKKSSELWGARGRADSGFPARGEDAR